MTTRLLCIFVAAVSATKAQTTGPETRAVTDPMTIHSAASAAARPVPIEDLFEITAVGGGAWSPDGQRIVYGSNASGRVNLWTMRADGAGATQLTKSDDRQTSAAWSPDGKWIVFAQDRGGNEIWDLYAVPSAGGEPANVTNSAQIAENNPHWSPDGSRIAISYKPKESPVTDIAILDWKTRQVRKLTNEQKQDSSWSVAAWSRDGSSILAVRQNNAIFSDSDVYLIDVASGKARNLTAHQGQQQIAASDLSADGKTALIASDAEGGYPNVALLDIPSGKLHWVTHTHWDAAPGRFSPDGKQFTYGINEDGRTHAYIAALSGGAGRELNMPQGLTSFSGNPTPFSPDGKLLLLTHQSSRRPSDFWAYDLSTNQPRQLTHSVKGNFNPAELPQSEIVHYKSFDGTMISAILSVPFNLKRDGSVPAIVLPHGGPTGQTVDSFSRQTAALSSRGYICIAPNVRGSTGYGKKFMEANIKDLGGGDLQDEVYAVKFLVATGFADASKIGITGGSYGGYMTLMAIGKTPEVWAAAVEQYGIINWLTMLQHEDAFLQQYEKSLLGDPEKERDIYLKASPITFIRNERAPLLVLQGENDPRVPKEEAEQVVEILKKEGRTVDVHYYAAEGHGFSKRENQIDALKRTVDWFDRCLKQHATGPAS
ncbi:MAG: S9 family peptidase [Acidobacteria bacterium]|nr:S9 family peptidase [Acidobacteriota bacterium]